MAIVNGSMARGRQKTPIKLSKVSSNHYDWQVRECGGYWGVVLDGDHIQLVKEHIQDGSLKYPRTVFATRGGAESLARRLNTRFDTFLFRAKKLI